MRGNLRKQRSRAGSLVDEENKEEVLREIQVINENTDFDDPKQIDFEILIVSDHASPSFKITYLLALCSEEWSN